MSLQTDRQTFTDKQTGIHRQEGNTGSTDRHTHTERDYSAAKTSDILTHKQKAWSATPNSLGLSALNHPGSLGQLAAALA